MSKMTDGFAWDQEDEDFGFDIGIEKPARKRWYRHLDVRSLSNGISANPKFGGFSRGSLVRKSARLKQESEESAEQVGGILGALPLWH
jgi:hypothetical protein